MVSTVAEFTYYYFNQTQFQSYVKVAKSLGESQSLPQVFYKGKWVEYTMKSKTEIISDEHILVAKGDNMRIRDNK